MYKIKYWIWASRPQTLIASIGPILVTSVLCYKYNMFNFSIFYFTLLAAMLIQIMTNFINDLYDFKKGSDRNDRIGPKRMIQQGYLLENEIKRAIQFLLFILIVIGLYLVSFGGWPILCIGLSSFLFAYLYTASKFSIAYNGLGEVFVFFYFGIIASIGTFYLQTLEFNYGAFLIGIIFGCLNVSLLVINNLRDYHEDTKSNKNTLVVLFGKKFGKIELVIMNILSFEFLYMLSNYLQKQMIFISLLPLGILALLLLYKVLSDSNFLNYKALPMFSIYTTMFTLVLLFTI